jgi:hypothetical protein
MEDGKTRKKGKSVLERRRLKHQRRAERAAANRRRELIGDRS